MKNEKKGEKKNQQKKKNRFRHQQRRQNQWLVVSHAISIFTKQATCNRRRLSMFRPSSNRFSGNCNIIIEHGLSLQPHELPVFKRQRTILMLILWCTLPNTHRLNRLNQTEMLLSPRLTSIIGIQRQITPKTKHLC